MHEKREKVKLILFRIGNVIGKHGHGSQRGRELEAWGFVRDLERKAVYSWDNMGYFFL